MSFTSSLSAIRCGPIFLIVSGTAVASVGPLKWTDDTLVNPDPQS
jgi:hypothetical protein